MLILRYLPRNVTARLCCKHVFWLCAKLLQSCSTLWPYGLQPTRLPCPWDSPGKNTGVGCHFLLPRSSPTQGSNPSLLTFSALAGGFFTISAISFIGNCHILFQSVCIILYAQYQCRSDPVSSLSSPAFGVVTTFCHSDTCDGSFNLHFRND